MAKDKGWQTELSRMIVLKDGAALTTPKWGTRALVAAPRDFSGTQ